MNSEFSHSSMDKKTLEEANRLIEKLKFPATAEHGFSMEPLESSRTDELRKELEPISEAISFMLRMIMAQQFSLGECRVKTPYSKLRPIINSDGELKWCCNHDPEHCA